MEEKVRIEIWFFPSYFNISTGDTSILHIGASNHHGNNFNKIQSGYEFSIIVIMTYARWAA